MFTSGCRSEHPNKILDKADYKVWFRIRNAMVKMFSSAKLDESLDPVDATSEFWRN